MTPRKEYTRRTYFEKGKKSLKGQISMEFMLISSIALLILIPTISVFFSFSQNSADDVQNAELGDVSRKLVNNFIYIYYQGEHSRIELEYGLPDKIEGMRIDTDWRLNMSELVFTRGGQDMVYHVPVIANGSFVKRQYSAGPKIFVLESRYDYKRNQSFVQVEVE